MVIDVAFAQVRPSPWREAVDLANMMLVLAVRTDAERVYQRALAYFTPDEIAEAFAAARGIASPTQLRSDDEAATGATSLAQFRALAPERRPISLQRWSLRRVLHGRRRRAVHVARARRTCTACSRPPSCAIADDAERAAPSDVMVLMAQAVPTAPAVPCVAVAARPAGRSAACACSAATGQFWLDSDQAGGNAVEVASAAAGVVPDRRCVARCRATRPGWRRYERPSQLPPALRVDPHVRLRRRLRHVPRTSSTTTRTRRRSSRSTPRSPFQPRADLVAEVDDAVRSLSLCGAGAPPCAGGAVVIGFGRRSAPPRRGPSRSVAGRRHRPRRRHHDHLAAAARHAAGLGHGAARRRARLGRRRRGGARR